VNLINVKLPYFGVALFFANLLFLLIFVLAMLYFLCKSTSKEQPEFLT
jgi:hypothetical protein